MRYFVKLFGFLCAFIDSQAQKKYRWMLINPFLKQRPKQSLTGLWLYFYK